MIGGIQYCPGIFTERISIWILPPEYKKSDALKAATGTRKCQVGE